MCSEQWLYIDITTPVAVYKIIQSDPAVEV